MSSTLVDLHMIPIVDMDLIVGERITPIRQSTRQAAKKLHASLSEKGLALLVNHGIPGAKIQEAYKKMNKFCKLPQDLRNEYAISENCSEKHGYILPERDRFCSGLPTQHCFNIQDLEGKMPEKDIPGFTEVITSLADDFKAVSKTVLQFIAIGLDLQTDYFLNDHKDMLCESSGSVMRLIYYPPSGHNFYNITRRHEHTDRGTLTLLSQDAENGLEVKLGDKWMRVGYLPGSILVIASDILEILTRGIYKAVCHKMVMPMEAKIRSRAQHAVAFFVHPSKSAFVSPIIFKPQEEGVPEKEKHKRCNIFTKCVSRNVSTEGLSSCC